MRSAYLLIAHGSRQKEANEGLWNLVARFRKVCPKRYVTGCFLEAAKPAIPEGIRECIHEGADEIFVMPLMLFPGRHVKRDIPVYIEEASREFPEVSFHYTTPIGDHPLLMELLEDKAQSIALKKK